MDFAAGEEIVMDIYDAGNNVNGSTRFNSNRPYTFGAGLGITFWWPR